jgi:hypothetical protein
MNDAKNTRESQLGPEQITAGTTAPGDDHPNRQEPFQQSAQGKHPSGLAATEEPQAQLFAADELPAIIGRWSEIQAEFVDEPQRAVQEADALVADLMQRLTRTFASERDQLESRWSGGDEVSTEDLRQGLRRYRSFFERLLAA